MSTYEPLLPSNASLLEQRAAEALAEIRRVPIPLRDLLNPQTCPEHLLPYLAWSFSVDRWHADWPVETKRKAITDAYYVHAHKGTIGALRRIVETLGYALEINEWWQQEPQGTPGTFYIGIDQRDQPMPDSTQRELQRLVEDTKPVSRQFDHITISGRLLGPGDMAAALSSSDAADLIYPKRFVTEVAPRERPLLRFHAFVNKTLPEAVNGK
ncbi:MULTISPECIES: phage tail protein I [unclassified Pseudomonas]|uniref:phage tail protein I n=1 Tax=unclassified Pseudomonas TaxID=196821 RepID=UPI000A0E7A72|nr:MULTISPECIES: phage tail protein I [unclassified Pseudomonas]SMF23544.1 phage tail protein, P2 protein I family [Pseudomonas sp. LAIL14HWK12:I11]SMR74282.1 phage tail protein, P2 protein I family [Pseudomonas sp. LAIL14HWK12:I10]SOD03547.1 phage tail protein, P2 protein I family [Pseudomonas sp. LAIL14HWK12:I8]